MTRLPVAVSSLFLLLSSLVLLAAAAPVTRHDRRALETAFELRQQGLHREFVDGTASSTRATPSDSLLTARTMSSLMRALLLELNSRLPAWLALAADAPPLLDANESTRQERVQLRDDAQQFPYWRMLPAYVASALPSSETGASTGVWESLCFRENSATLSADSDGSNFVLRLTHKRAKASLCTDDYLIATVASLQLESVSCGWAPLCDGTAEFKWTLSEDATPAERFDLDNKGVRIFRFVDDTETTLKSLQKTLALFQALSTQQVSEEDAAVNLDFLAKYAHVYSHARNISSVPIDASFISSGDFFGIMRLDGLDPMLAWAMGAATGHMALALWQGDQLYIVESTNKNSYWSVNGVQKTPYAIWLQRAREANYNVVWSPLSSDAAARFNVSAANAYFASIEGFDYGYQTLLWGWQDTTEDNYPCLPPTFAAPLCLTAHHVQILFGFLDRSSPDIGSVLYREAFNHRLKSSNLSYAELLQRANETDVRAEELPTIVEQDSWIYNITRYDQPSHGPALVCCTFVCNMWKHAGVFQGMDDFQCSEQTNFDAYSLNILTRPKPLPSVCSTADSDNFLCQIEGSYSVNLGAAFASKAAYSHMNEHCPSLAPDYNRSSNC